MRTAILLTVLLLAAPAAFAQRNAGTHFGLGVRIGAGSSNSVAGVVDEDASGLSDITFLVPVDINGAFRVEPELGIARISLSDDDSDAEITGTQYTAGLGIFALSPQGDVTMTYGLRAGMTSFSQSIDTGGGDADASIRRISVGPAVGGEYYLADRFSIGAEVGLDYQIYSFDGDILEDVDVNGFATRTSAILRFFF